MKSNEIFAELQKKGDRESAIKMAAYMRNKFLFLGVHPPERKNICKETYKQAKKNQAVDWEFLIGCWKNDYREMQYVAMDYLVATQKLLTSEDVDKIKDLAQSKEWWDTIDGLDRVIGNIALSYPEVNNTLLEWSIDEDIWLRRIAIDHQLLRKDRTDVDLLESIIINNLGQTEYFINKAIGWSLRDYSKTNPEWVSEFLEKYQKQLSPLSMKEASKYL